VPHEVDGALDEHPPEIRVLTLAEQLGSGLDANLGTALGQLSELIIGQAVEEAKSAKLVGAHQAAARCRCATRSSSTAGMVGFVMKSASARSVAGRAGVRAGRAERFSQAGEVISGRCLRGHVIQQRAHRVEVGEDFAPDLLRGAHRVH
jgi:hypothetical protein